MTAVRPTFVLGGTAVVLALLGGTLGILAQFDGPLRLLVAVIDTTPSPAAAAEVDSQLPTFDGADATRTQQPVTLTPAITGVPQPTDFVWIPGRADRVIVLSKTGTAWLVDVDADEARPWITLDVATTAELGLLGIALHPDFGANGRFWIDHTPPRGGRRSATVLSEWHVDPTTLADPRHVADLLEVDQPFQNHNGGQIAFGPDGMLYLGLGDGGLRADPHGTGQDPTGWLGSMLRIDVTPAGSYAVPPDNPFVGVAGAKPEIWAIGLRNPWRFSFDPRGRLVVADVGQDRLEEIDLVARGDNLGWSIKEGDRCFDPPEDCPEAGLVDPIAVYGRDEGVSVTGGVVWTGDGPLAGQYVFGDYGTGRLWALTLPDAAGETAERVALGRFAISPTAFAADPQGRVWVADFRSGAIYRILPAG